MKKLRILLPIILTSPLLIIPFVLTSCNNQHSRLTRDDWEDNTKTALNQCISNYGIDGKYYSKDNYVVFDFDNTSAIFDIAHIGTTYQIERMCYQLSKEELRSALASTLGDTSRSLSEYDYDFTYDTLINDIVTHYEKLQTKYGPFTYKGVDESKLEQLHAEDDWIDFSAKLRFMYTVVSKTQGDHERCKWQTFQLAGMTPQQVYEYEYACLAYYSTVKSHYETWTAKTKITGSETIATYKITQGISVTKNIQELYKVIKDNGLDIWIVSASQIDQVRAAADVFGLGQYVKGAIAIPVKLNSDGKYIAEYEKNGKGYIKENGQWVLMDKTNPNFTTGVGKSLTIKDVIAPYYNNHGPIMCFGDSTGDFNFCTEFKDTKLCVCFNRADRSVKDGGGLMSAIAMYQKLNEVTLEKANSNNDTLYCLQGRDDNELRSFRNSHKTIKLGQTKEELFLNKDNYTLLYYIMYNKLSISAACQLSIKDTAIEGITVGFLDEYIGYHTR